MRHARSPGFTTIRLMHAWLRGLFEADPYFLTIPDYPVPRSPRRPGEALNHHWLRHSNPNVYVGFGVYPALILLLHPRWPIICRCRAERATGWIVFGLRPDGRERVMSLFGTHRLAETGARSGP